MLRRRIHVPVVMQMEALECGAASLAMILAYYKKWVPLEQLRTDCGISRDGSNALNILRAARFYGMEANAYRYGTLEALKQAKLPCILFWNFNHFVVFKGFHGNHALINDPARGSIRVEMGEFDTSFTGVCLCFEPTAAFEPGGHRRSMAAFAKSRLQGTLASFLFVMFSGILVSVLGVVYPAFARVFMDRLLVGQNPEWLYPFIFLMCAVVVLQAIVLSIRALYLYRISGKLAVSSSASFLWHVLRLPMEFFSQRMSGDIARRQSYNSTIAITLISQLAPTLLNIVLTVFYLVVMIRYSLLITAVSLACVIINIGLSQVIARKRVNITRLQMRDAGKLSAVLSSGIQMIETIKATGAEEGYFQRWSGYQASVNAASVRYTKLNQYLGALPGVIKALTNTAVVGLGVLLVMNNQFTVGMILAFQGLLSSLLSPVDSLISVGQSVQEMRTSMERIEDVMDYPDDVEDNDTDTLKDGDFVKLPGTLEMRNVSFGYSRLSPPLIQNFNLKLEQGASVAFVGPSGCGKSTLAKLISGLYKPWSGDILIGGIPLEKIPHEQLTASLSVVDQDVVLFEDTIADNIKMWDNSIDNHAMVLAAKDAQLSDDIMQREGGYQYRILDGGRDFSGGQRQRMEIARALVQDPTLLIMDEATSALDAKTEAEVVANINKRGITSIVIAHRLSTIRNCDEIIVIDNGQVTEQGTHEQLLLQKGLYYQLVTTE
ncbi:MAG: NHLP family bacteriocin export ABC transporter peptidase/permease/ATPase subunit [Bacillota bacterium]